MTRVAALSLRPFEGSKRLWRSWPSKRHKAGFSRRKGYVSWKRYKIWWATCALNYCLFFNTGLSFPKFILDHSPNSALIIHAALDPFCIFSTQPQKERMWILGREASSTRIQRFSTDVSSITSRFASYLTNHIIDGVGYQSVPAESWHRNTFIRY